MSNKLRLNVLLGAIILLVGTGSAMAESTYGYNSAGAAAAVTATARVNLSVTVPKLILLRVGSAGATVDTLSWALNASIPATPTVPAATADSAAVVWSGVAPTLAPATATATTVASAWTNATAGTINCAVTGLAAGGPTLANFTVSGAGTLTHPGVNLSACTSTSFASGSVQTSTWTYTLGGTPTSWTPGVYTAVITYTAQGV